MTERDGTNLYCPALRCPARIDGRGSRRRARPLVAAGLTLALLVACRTAPPDRFIVEPGRGYENVASALTRVIEQEIRDKSLPALSIALVVGPNVVWARGFGVADPDANLPATAETVYRVGSVSKLFTDIGVMQLQERGKVDLDTPIDHYLPEFRPHNPFGKPITLRMLMSHRAGLVREPPVGHYFDPTHPTLAETVASLNRTSLVYEPGTRIKYSNAGVAVVGYVIEKLEGKPFASWLKANVLDQIGLSRSGFEPTPDITSRLSKATMWTFDGRRFPAPVFELGMTPAGSMYSTVLDLGKFLSMLFARGRAEGYQVLSPATLSRMWEPQFGTAGQHDGYGIGFRVSNLNGQRRLGHSGAIYGFSTELALLPESDLGVVVVSSMDAVNTVTTRIADLSLRLLAASRDGRALPTFEEPAPVPKDVMAQLVGRYARVDPKPTDEGDAYREATEDPPVAQSLEFLERDGQLFLAQPELRDTMRRVGTTLRVDGRLTTGPTVVITETPGRLDVGGHAYQRVESPRPPDPPASWEGLIGEYGWDHNVLYIRERDGQLHALIEWFFDYPLDEASPTEFWFPNHGLYAGERADFVRDERGVATEVSIGGVIFKRRQKIDQGQTYTITPLKPVAELKAMALAARPPDEQAPAAADLVDLAPLDASIKFDIRYATTNNFMQTPFYDEPRAFLQRPAAEALLRAHQSLASRGYGLLIHDAYRPWYVTKAFWEATPESERHFVADPARGSRHNRGCAVDLTLYDLATGQPVRMTGGYDEFSDRSYPDYPGGTSAQRWHRELLRAAMQAQGFTVYEYEWWHFDYRDWEQYPIMNVTFDAIPAPAPVETTPPRKTVKRKS
ncbi:MAG: serine hydrolase [Vicinamibacterales bacterium]